MTHLHQQTRQQANERSSYPEGSAPWPTISFLRHPKSLTQPDLHFQITDHTPSQQFHEPNSSSLPRVRQRPTDHHKNLPSRVIAGLERGGLSRGSSDSSTGIDIHEALD